MSPCRCRHQSGPLSILSSHSLVLCITDASHFDSESNWHNCWCRPMTKIVRVTRRRVRKEKTSGLSRRGIPLTRMYSIVDLKTLDMHCTCQWTNKLLHSSCSITYSALSWFLDFSIRSFVCSSGRVTDRPTFPAKNGRGQNLEHSTQGLRRALTSDSSIGLLYTTNHSTPNCIRQKRQELNAGHV